MALPLEDYAFVGDAHGAALVGRDGSVDWLCLPRFDSSACLAALLDTPKAGRWLLAPAGAKTSSRWRYRGDTLVLESDWETSSGAVRVVDFMPPKGQASDLVRLVEGLSGRVEMRMELRVRFGDGRVVPWVRRLPDGRLALVAGPDALYLDTPAPLHGEDLSTVSTFAVSAGQRVPFVLTWSASHLPPPARVDADRAENDTEAWWGSWMSTCTYRGPYDDAVRRSLVVLKGLTFQPTGGIVAAPTTSLPEQLGGPRNWDYRYCWLRDATITLLALLEGGFHAEAAAWRRWLLRAVAGDPADLQIMYGVAGERRLDERVLPWLAGYEGAAPVRVGNAAVDQLQLDVYGEVLDALHQSRMAGLPVATEGGAHADTRAHAGSGRGGRHVSVDSGDGSGHDPSWGLQVALLDFLESAWTRPDSGMWEMRGPARHHTYSKVMAWVAVDRAVKGAEQFGLPAPIDHWRALRAQIHDDVITHAYDSERNTFTQSYGSPYLDASLLNIGLVGFLPADDPRVAGTVDAVSRDLTTDGGLLLRYDPQASADGLPGREGAFLACTFWLAESQALLGRHDQARATFERLLDLRTDLGLLSEEYDTTAGRLVGNFPQAFSHVPLITTAGALQRASARSRGSAAPAG